MIAPRPFIVAEVSKNWHRGVPETPGLVSQALERVIQVNLLRGYRLHSFTLNRLVVSDCELNETIVAVFEAIDDAARPSTPDADAPAQVGTDAGVGTKVGTNGKWR